MLKKLLVSEWMSKKVVSVDIADNTKHAFYLMRFNHIRFLPVLHEGNLVGVVTDRDLRLPESQLKPARDCYHLERALPIKKIMTTEPHTLMPGDNVETAARIMVERKFGGFPVVSGPHSKKLVGILTVSDVMRALVHVIEEKKL